MVPKPQIYIAENNLKNLAGPMSILNITEQILSIGISPRHDRVSYGSGRSASIFIRAGRGTRAPTHTSTQRIQTHDSQQREAKSQWNLARFHHSLRGESVGSPVRSLIYGLIPLI
jgi:hypothetical protein